MSEKAEFRQWVARTMEAHERALLRYAFHLTRDRERAREVVQDTFLELCRQDRSRVEKFIRQWLFTVCRNRIVDHRRREKSAAGAPELALGTEPAHASPCQALERKEETERALEAIALLAANQREVLSLKLQGDLSYKEIGAILGLTASHVGYLLCLALKELRTQLAASEHAPRAKRGKS